VRRPVRERTAHARPALRRAAGVLVARPVALRPARFARIRRGVWYGPRTWRRLDARPWEGRGRVTQQLRARANGAGAGADVSEFDKRIIEHLQQDGRRPFTQIAADLGVSEAAVRARTNRLIERGILQIVGVTDPLKLGFHQQAMIGVRCQADRLLEVATEVAAFPEVAYLVVTAGSYDLLIEVVCEDNDALLRFLTERLRRVEGVRETETFVYLRMVKQVYAWGTR